MITVAGGWACLAVVLVAAPSAVAAPAGLARVRLHVETDSDGLCPTAAELRDAVVAKLGTDPFAEPAELELRVSERREANGFGATVERFDPQGRLLGSQQLLEPGPNCRELSASLTLVLSIAIDPSSFSPPATPWSRPAADLPVPPLTDGASASAPPTGRVAAQRSSMAIARPPAPPITLTASAGAFGMLGSLPAPAAGAEIELEARRARYSLALAGEATSVAGVTVSATGSVQAALFAGALLPCVHIAWLGVCGRAVAGALANSASNLPDGPEGHRGTTPYLALGARALADIPLFGGLSLRPEITAEVPLLKTALLVGTQSVWQTSPVAGLAGLSLAARLP